LSLIDLLLLLLFVSNSEIKITTPNMGLRGGERGTRGRCWPCGWRRIASPSSFQQFKIGKIEIFVVD